MAANRCFSLAMAAGAAVPSRELWKPGTEGNSAGWRAVETQGSYGVGAGAVAGVVAGVASPVPRPALAMTVPGGSEIVKVVPAPGLLSTVRPPTSVSARSFAMARPRPVTLARSRLGFL